MQAQKQFFAIVLALAMLGATPAPRHTPRPYVPPPAPDAVTHHIGQVAGRDIRYTARAGTITLRNDKDQITARMFYVAYTKDGSDPSRRPVTFFYNGGPGSSSVWLHMGSLAPMRVEVANGSPTAPAPFKLIDNQYSLIDKTDEVFVDAPNTGYSRVLGYGRPKDFMGVDQDGRAFTQFIQRYISQFSRWNSPKFLFGESYGTTRDAVLVNMLQRAGIAMNGVVFQSSILNFGLGGLGGGQPIGGGDWSYVLYLPTEAATAWYHHMAAGHPANLNAFLRGVEHFAGNEYLHALAAGDTLSGAERANVIAKLHAYTGLSTQYISDSNLRVPYPRFLAQLLRNRGIILGRYDSRYQTFTDDPMSDRPDWDPSDVGIAGAFVGTFHQYITGRLHYETNLQYRPTAYGGQLGAPWDMHHNGNPPPANVVPDLADAMSQNPRLHIFSANGYYDFATPYFATVYTLEHLGIAPSLYKNVSFGFYQSGHMIYLNPSALAAYKADLARWYDLTLSAR